MLLGLRIGSFGIACLVLAACGGGGSGPTQSSTPTPTATPTTAPTPSSSPVPTGTPSPATISDGGSTNRKPFTIIVNNDDTVSVTQDGQTRAATASSTSVSQLFTDILANQPLSNVATNNGCTKSASYGSTTTLTYNGSSTQDISCPPSSTSPAQTLYVDVENIESQVGPFNN